MNDAVKFPTMGMNNDRKCLEQSISWSLFRDQRLKIINQKNSLFLKCLKYGGNNKKHMTVSC